jgi:hypothetical protein
VIVDAFTFALLQWPIVAAPGFLGWLARLPLRLLMMLVCCAGTDRMLPLRLLMLLLPLPPPPPPRCCWVRLYSAVRQTCSGTHLTAAQVTRTQHAVRVPHAGGCHALSAIALLHDAWLSRKSCA